MSDVSVTEVRIATSRILFLSFQDGLSIALRKLAQHYNNEPGPWLDEIEVEVFNDIKSIVPEGLDITVEVSALKAALATASVFFGEFREALASKAITARRLSRV